ncbi:MAG TPA: DNA alkylation repair protein [Candidatus Binatia bacterium]|nr:DNA alkylation repair protein [Candidatus Binatia bacterium]
MSKSPAYVAEHIRRVLLDGASAPHTEEVRRFFRQEVKSRGWYTAELRKVAVRFRRTIVAQNGPPFLLQVADRLFSGDVLEEKIFAVLMLQGIVGELGKPEFRLFESWLDRVSSWADDDALAHYLLGPMIAADARLLARPLRWAKSKGRWHRRAAAVSLIHSTRRHGNFDHVQRVTELLLGSDDDMVRKGVGWLLREAAKANPEQTVAYLMSIRDRAPRRVLRTACETLPAMTGEKILGKRTKAAGIQ